MLKINAINRGRQPMPTYATSQSAGMDLRANLEEPVVLHPMERRLIPTGLHIALPEGYEAQVRPRSGLALKHGLTVLNAPGTIPTIAVRLVWCLSTYRRKTSPSTTESALPSW